MALKFGGDLEDVGTDETGLMALLGGGEPEGDSQSAGFRRQAETDAQLDAELDTDPEPGYEKPGLEDRIFPDEPKPLGAKRVTQAVRKDIKGKVGMLLTMAAVPLRQRDPVCVGALMEAIPDQEDEDGDVSIGIAGALTDLICDSPDMVKWFTASGKYMKWFTLMMTVQPVLTVAFHHHVTHAITDEGGPADTQDWTQYGV